MIFEHDIPDLAGRHVFPGQFTNALFGPQCPNFAGQALLTSFVRFVEAAGFQYRSARAYAIEFVAQPSSLYGFYNATSGFEACIGFMQRSVRCMRAIRSRPETLAVNQALFLQRPAYMAGAVQDRITNIRDAIQHSYDQVVNGTITQGTPFMLYLAGTDRPTPTPDQPDQTTKTWDRLEIGPHRVSFVEVASWLADMAVSAEAIVGYRP